MRRTLGLISIHMEIWFFIINSYTNFAKRPREHQFIWKIEIYYKFVHKFHQETTRASHCGVGESLYLTIRPWDDESFRVNTNSYINLIIYNKFIYKFHQETMRASHCGVGGARDLTVSPRFDHETARTLGSVPIPWENWFLL